MVTAPTWAPRWARSAPDVGAARRRSAPPQSDERHHVWLAYPAAHRRARRTYPDDTAPRSAIVHSWWERHNPRNLAGSGVALQTFLCTKSETDGVQCVLRGTVWCCGAARRGVAWVGPGQPRVPLDRNPYPTRAATPRGRTAPTLGAPTRSPHRAPPRWRAAPTPPPTRPSGAVPRKLGAPHPHATPHHPAARRGGAAPGGV
jgi:hypothetical protein